MNSTLRKRDKCCRICGATERLQTHHIFPKGHPKRNLLKFQTVLCEVCHKHINLIWNKEIPKPKRGREGFLEDEEIKQSYIKD